MKTITLEEIYADPHVLDSLLAAGEPVEILREGKKVGSLLPAEEVIDDVLRERRFNGGD